MKPTELIWLANVVELATTVPRLKRALRRALGLLSREYPTGINEWTHEECVALEADLRNALAMVVDADALLEGPDV
jgi:hypothetical protein